jgi:hypothetical protein
MTATIPTPIVENFVENIAIGADSARPVECFSGLHHARAFHTAVDRSDQNHGIIYCRRAAWIDRDSAGCVGTTRGPRHFMTTTDRPESTATTSPVIKVVVADDLPASALDLLRAEPGWVVDARPGRKPDELLRDVADADALMVRSATKVTAAVIQAAPRLRIVARAGTGVDNVDVTAASARGILVVNAPGANSISVAEHACAMILSLARAVPAADRAMKDGKWEK